MNSPRSTPRLTLLVLLLAAFAWRLHHIDFQSLWRDEVDAIIFATRSLGQTLEMFTLGGQNGALYFLGLRPWFRLVGTSEYALRFPSTCFNVVSIVLLWQVARRLLGEAGQPPVSAALAVNQTGGKRGFLMHTRSFLGNTPLLATILFAVHPYQTWFSQEGKMYTLAVMLTLLATWLWWAGITRGDERGGWRLWLGYAATVSVAIYSHLLLVLLIPLHAAWFLLAWPVSRRRWRGYGGALAMLTLPYLPMLVWQWDLLVEGLVSNEQTTLFGFTPLPEMLRVLLFSHTWGFREYNAEVLPLAPIFFLALAGAALGTDEIRARIGQAAVDVDADAADATPVAAAADRVTPSAWRRLALLGTWVLGPIACLYGVSLVQPLFTPRYLIWIAPAVLMLVALGVRVVLHSLNSRVLGTSLAGVLVIYVVGLWLNVGWQQQTEVTKFQLREAVHYIHERREASDLLILQIPYLEWTYRYYSSNQGPSPLFDSDARLANWLGGPYTNWLDDPALQGEVDQQIEGMATRARNAYTNEAWLLLSEVEWADRRGLTQGWFDQNAELLDEQNFHGVSVRHYRMEGQP